MKGLCMTYLTYSSICDDFLSLIRYRINLLRRLSLPELKHLWSRWSRRRASQNICQAQPEIKMKIFKELISGGLILFRQSYLFIDIRKTGDTFKIVC